MNRLKVKLKPKTGVRLPAYGSLGASGFDLAAYEDTIIEPFKRVLVPTGLSFELPHGYELQIRPRSGVTLKTDILVLFGTVDWDYRGDVGILVVNTGNRNITIHAGDRIAQAVLAPVFRAVFDIVEELSETERGGNGFGSTGE